MILREHETAAVGARWSDANRVLTERHLGVLLRYQDRSEGSRLFAPIHRGLKATSWVGAIGIGDRQLEVLPKVDREGEADARNNLHAMIATAGLVPAAEADLARLGNAQKPLLVAYMDRYVRGLAQEWRRGPIRRYVSEEENRPYLKGKLLLQRQLRDNLVHRERFYTAADELTLDNPLARLLKAALRPCIRQNQAQAVSRRARNLLLDFDGVGDWKPSAYEARPVAVDRRSERFAPLLAMARFILEQVSPSPVRESTQIHALMFDMNVIFERFIAVMLRRALGPRGYEVRAQATGKALLRREGRMCFALQPDVVIKRHGVVVAVVDTKWKRLDPAKPHCNVQQSDMYQMYAYGREFRSPRTVLLYPRWGSLSEIAMTYDHLRPFAVGAPAPRIVVATVDVSMSLAAPGNLEALRQSLTRIALGTVSD